MSNNVNWPTHSDGKPKKLREMTEAERKSVAKQAFMNEFGSEASKFMDSFDAAFNRVFGENK